MADIPPSRATDDYQSRTDDFATSRLTDIPPSRRIIRYTANDRTNHWLIALSFILVALSGLALFHPLFYWLSALFGSGTWARILHPFFGVFMFVCFLLFSLRVGRHNVLTRDDRRWFSQIGDVVNGREDRLPEAGRYNAGQKALFFALVLFMIVLLITGLIMWQEYFWAYFAVSAVRIAAVLHALFAVLMICAIIVHIYAAIWVKGSMQAMVRGTVTPGWVYKHHRAWFRQLYKRPDRKQPRPDITV